MPCVVLLCVNVGGVILRVIVCEIGICVVVLLPVPALARGPILHIAFAVAIARTTFGIALRVLAPRRRLGKVASGGFGGSGGIVGDASFGR